MYGWIFKKVGWKFFAVGAATALVGSKFVRPAAVSLVQGGLSLSDAAASTWNEAKAQTSRLVADANALRHAPPATAFADGETVGADILAEIRALRDDLAAVKADVAAQGKA